MPDRISLAPAGPEDFAAIRRCVEKYFTHDHLVFNSQVEAAVLELLSEPSLGQYFFILRDGACAGYACVTHGFDAEAGGRMGWLTDFYLEEEWRGQGVGKSALDQIISLAPQYGWQTISLVVIDGNTRAESLYCGHGFTRDKGRAGFSLKLKGR